MPKAAKHCHLLVAVVRITLLCTFIYLFLFILFVLFFFVRGHIERGKKDKSLIRTTAVFTISAILIGQ